MSTQARKSKITAGMSVKEIELEEQAAKAANLPPPETMGADGETGQGGQKIEE